MHTVIYGRSLQTTAHRELVLENATLQAPELHDMQAFVPLSNNTDLMPLLWQHLPSTH